MKRIFILGAASFAAQKHTGQLRKGSGSEPYINHPLQVANLLATLGKVSKPEILAAALLHDTIEDTDATFEDIEMQFGVTVAKIVAEVTDDKSLPKEVRKQKQIEQAPHLSNDAKQLKLADKISNITDVMNNPPNDWSIDRRLDYVKWGEKVVAGLRGSNQLLEDHFDGLVVKVKAGLRS